MRRPLSSTVSVENGVYFLDELAREARGMKSIITRSLPERRTVNEKPLLLLELGGLSKGQFLRNLKKSSGREGIA
jgi:hypothetical protein